jgi:hypothetical protein
MALDQPFPLGTFKVEPGPGSTRTRLLSAGPIGLYKGGSTMRSLALKVAPQVELTQSERAAASIGRPQML